MYLSHFVSVPGAPVEFCFGVLVSCSWDLLMDVALAMVLCPPFPLRPPLLPLIKPLWDTCSNFKIFHDLSRPSIVFTLEGATPWTTSRCSWKKCVSWPAPSNILPVALALTRPFWSILAQAKFAQTTELANRCWQWQLLRPVPTMAVGAQAALGRWFLNQPR